MREILPLENLTISQFLRRTVQRFPDHPAMEYMGRVWTYREMDEAVDRTARRLLSWGVRRGDRVGLWCETEPNTILLLYALPRIGAVAVFLNTSLQRAELAELLRRTEVSRLIVTDGYKELNFLTLCRELTAEIPTLEAVLYAGLSGESDGFQTLDGIGETTVEELSLAEEAVTSQDVGYILYTSGTTSLPKAVMDTQYSRVNSGIQQAHDLGATEHDRFCAAMPIFHCFCLSVNVMAACAAGACLCLPESRKTAAILETLSQRKCTVFNSVPTLFHAILSRSDFVSWDLSSLRTGFIGGGFYSPELFQQINDGFGFTLLSSLGQTEATGGLTAAHLDDPLEVRATTVGHFMDHVEGKIVHIETGKNQPAGETGEICIRGYLVMKGYYGQPEETAKAVDPDGWLHTGDMGYLDENGNVHLTGRLKELIIRGGENISPSEIETAALASCCEIRECKAVGVPDLHYGEEVCLCAVLQEGAALDEPELRARLTRRLAAYKVPKYILFFEGLPKTTVGKVRLTALVQMIHNNCPALIDFPADAAIK